MRNVQFTAKAYEELTFWLNNDVKTAKKIVELLHSCLKNPFDGVGKPEPLKHQYQGCWSRRINDSDRLVYKVEENLIIVISCKFHY